MSKRFNIYIPSGDSGVEVHRMKKWLRQPREHVPEGIDVNRQNSYQLRSTLKHQGWVDRETETEVRLISPESDTLSRVDKLFGQFERRRYNVYIPSGDSGVEVHRMKEWLRQHPEHIPEGLDVGEYDAFAVHTALQRQGWVDQETESEVRLISPDSDTELRVAKLFGQSEDEETNLDGDPVFTLEHQLRDFFAENINTILVNGRHLRLYEDEEGQEGVEYQTVTGRIDILAIDDDGAFYVIEFKRDRASDKVVGQVARYMGCIQRTIAVGREVNGVIVAKDIDRNLRYAASVIPQVHLFEYQMEFHLNEADEIGS